MTSEMGSKTLLKSTINLLTQLIRFLINKRPENCHKPKKLRPQSHFQRVQALSTFLCVVGHFAPRVPYERPYAPCCLQNPINAASGLSDGQRGLIALIASGFKLGKSERIAAGLGMMWRGRRLSHPLHIGAQHCVHPGLISSPLGAEPLHDFLVKIGRDPYFGLPRP
jgi:hypothetical protein